MANEVRIRWGSAVAGARVRSNVYLKTFVPEYSKMSANPLAAFCNQLVAFFEDLVDTYPEEKDIALASQAIKMMKMANPRRLHSVFMEIITDDFFSRIMNEDEQYLIQNAKALLDTEYKDLAFAFWIFDKHWSSMTEVNKDHVWKYLKSIAILARRVPSSSVH